MGSEHGPAVWRECWLGGILWSEPGWRLLSPQTELVLVQAMVFPSGGAKKYLDSGYIVIPVGLGDGLDMPGKESQAVLSWLLKL